jgi:chlorite dismutase
MSDNTLFLQLQIFDIEPAAGPRAMVSALSRRLREKRIDGVIYGDANDHRGIGLLTWAADPGDILDNVHALLGGKRFSALTPRPGWVMFGRVSGDAAANTPEVLLNGDRNWAAWYPVRNKAEWALLDDAAQAKVHKAHGTVAKSFTDDGRVAYVRLACHGIDPEDNDQIFGLTAGSLMDISLLQEAMRGTAQVATHVSKMGPVFVGRKIWQNPAVEVPEPEATEDASSAPAEEANSAPAEESAAPANASAEATTDAPAGESEASDGWTEDN